MYSIRKNSDLFFGEKGQECFFIVYMQTIPTSLTLKQKTKPCCSPWDQALTWAVPPLPVPLHRAPHIEGRLSAGLP